jgi:hypothetical protein
MVLSFGSSLSECSGAILRLLSRFHGLANMLIT